MNQHNAFLIQEKISNILSVSRQAVKFSDQELILKALSITHEIFQEKIIEQRGQFKKNICAAQNDENKPYFKCFDCSNILNHIYCEDCFVREKHLNHVVTYHYCDQNGGCCDCGDQFVMKKESFCNKHQQNLYQMPNPNFVLGEQFVKQFEEFIMMSFCLLFNLIDDIVDYPNGFLDFFLQIKQNQISVADQETLKTLRESQNKLNDALKVNIMINRVLNFLVTDNVLFGLLISQCSQKPINNDIQQQLQMRHLHNQNTFQQFQVSKIPQQCNCSILELYIKYHIFLSGFDEEFEENIVFIFIQLQVDDDFKLLACKQFLLYFNHLYRQFQTYRLFMNNSQQITINISRNMFSEQSYELELLPQLLKHEDINQLIIINKLHQSQLFTYLYQFMGHIIIAILSEYKSNQSIQFYQIFDINMRNLLFMPLCNQQSEGMIEVFQNIITLQFHQETVKLLFDQIKGQLEPQSDEFYSVSLNQKSSEFKMLQKSSLLINVLTKTYPVIQTQISNFNFFIQSPQNRVNCLKIQISVLSSYRNILRIIFETWYDTYKNYNQGLQNIIRVIINYYLNNFTDQFSLNETDQPLNQFLKNQVISDRNFISILATYLVEFKTTNQTYDDLLELSGHSQEHFKHVMNHLLQRTMLSYIVLRDEQLLLYNGQIKQYNSGETSTKLLTNCDWKSEISLESVDITYFQIYAFIFGSEGIQDIIKCNQQISSLLNKKCNPSQLICRIALTDFEYFQTSYFSQYGGLSEQFQKSLSKIFQTIFFAQTFQSQDQLISILKQISIESRIDLQQIILTSCDLNQDNGQLQLKKSLQPAHYEPIFTQQIPDLKDFINNKLRNQGDYYTELFGNSLEYELSDLANPKSTLTYKRLAILKSIGNDQNQTLLLRIVNIIERKIEEKDFKGIERILEENSIYINLLFQVNHYLCKDNQVTVQNLNYILQICLQNQNQLKKDIFNNYIDLLDHREPCNFISNVNSIQKKFQIKKQQLKKRFQEKNEQIPAINLERIGDKICSICQSNFQSQENQCRLLLIQHTNLHKYYQHMSEMNQFNFLFSQHVSACPHTFHFLCLAKQYQKITNNLFKCCICSQYYNFLLMDTQNLSDLSNEQLKENIAVFIQSQDNNKQDYYYKNFFLANCWDIPGLIKDIITKCLCNLLYQLLCDVKSFIQNDYPQILQIFIKLISLAYKSGQKSLLLDLQCNTDSVVMRFILLVDKFIIQQNDQKEFYQSIQKLLFSEKDVELLSNIFLGQQINIVDSFLIFDLIKADLQSDLMLRFKPNFKEFLLKYLLSPCQKKKCNSTKLPQNQYYKPNFQLQFLCLVCFKKMCNFCKKKQMDSNLFNHTTKKHEGKTLYLNIHTGEIIIVYKQHQIQSKNYLFKNLIGEKAALHFEKSQYYERYKLNLKAIDEIIETILKEKQLNRVLQEKCNVQES